MYRMRPFPVLQMSGRRIYCYHTPVMGNEAYPLSPPHDVPLPSNPPPLPSYMGIKTLIFGHLKTKA